MLRHTGLDRWVSRAKYFARLVLQPEFRRIEHINRLEYRAWKRDYGAALGPPLYPRGAARKALIVTKGTINGAKIEVGLLKGLELGGFVPVVLTDRRFVKYYRLAGVRHFIHWEQFTEQAPVAEAEAFIAAARDVADLLPVEVEGARVGKFAVSTTFRTLRAGRLDFSLDITRRTLTEHLASGMARAAAARRIVDRIQPDLALFMGNRYTGHGELMDVCVDRGIDAVAWFDAHRSSSLMLKRYNRANRDQHHGSLSDDSWAELTQGPWTAAERSELQTELRDTYAAGDWYSRGGTQVNKGIVGPADLRRRLDLDPRKKTAVIFPHIVWDATLFWGTDLFHHYEDWLVETVKAAFANPSLNWVIKIHPAHVAKSAMERYDGEPAELVAIRERVGPCPPHVTVIGPDTDINTYSLFSVMDYCLTVRGTIGIEAASLGIPVLTAGTGRYDHRGFTHDSATRADYLSRLAALHTMPPLTAAERELAERFAYGAFLLRPLPLTSLTVEHERDIEATMRVRVNARTAAELQSAPDLNALGAWAADGRQEDFLWRRPAGAALGRSA
jgi:hypothetical protein